MTFARDEFIELMDDIEAGDTIIFKSIDRFSRNQNEGLEKYIDLLSKGVNLVFIDNPNISTDYVKGLLNIAKECDSEITKEFSLFFVKVMLLTEFDRAEKERALISKRTKEGIAASQKKSGRKVGQLDKMTNALKTDIERYIKNHSIKGIDIMRKHNISRNTFKKYVSVVERDEEICQNN